MTVRPEQYRGVAEIIRKDGFYGLDDVDREIILLALDRCGVTTPRAKTSGYRCAVCGTTDLLAYMRCNRPDCLDGRDR